MNALALHAAFEFRNGLRNRALLLLLYLFPLGFYLLGSALMVGVNPLMRDTLVPAMVLFALIAGTVLGLPDPIVAAREAGIYRSFWIHGVPATAILLLPAGATLVHLSVVSAVIAASAPLVFGAPLPTNPWAFVGVAAAAGAALAALGLVIAVISPNTRSTILWSQLIFLPSVLLGGMMMPAEAITGALSDASRLLPATHAMNAFRGLAYGTETAFPPTVSLLVLLAGAAIGLVVALALFQWDRRVGARRAHPVWALAALLPYVVAVVLG